MFYSQRWWASRLYYGYAGKQEKQRTDDRRSGFISGDKHRIVYRLVSEITDSYMAR